MQYSADLYWSFSSDKDIVYQLIEEPGVLVSNNTDSVNQNITKTLMFCIEAPP